MQNQPARRAQPLRIAHRHSGKTATSASEPYRLSKSPQADSRYRSSQERPKINPSTQGISRWEDEENAPNETNPPPRWSSHFAVHERHSVKSKSDYCGLRCISFLCNCGKSLAVSLFKYSEVVGEIWELCSSSIAELPPPLSNIACHSRRSVTLPSECVSHSGPV
jgi:hypothetical protein